MCCWKRVRLEERGGLRSYQHSTSWWCFSNGLSDWWLWWQLGDEARAVSMRDVFLVLQCVFSLREGVDTTTGYVNGGKSRKKPMLPEKVRGEVVGRGRSSASSNRIRAGCGPQKTGNNYDHDVHPLIHNKIHHHHSHLAYVDTGFRSLRSLVPLKLCQSPA